MNVSSSSILTSTSVSTAAVTSGRQQSISSQRGPSSTTNHNSNAYLDVPGSDQQHPQQLSNRRRSSLDSTYSEASDLSFLTNDFHQHALTRRFSNASNMSSYTAQSIHSRSPPTWRQKASDLYDQNYGALLVLLSQMFGSGMTITTRILEQPGPHGEPMHPFQILFVRQSLTVLFCTLYAVMTKSIPHFPLGPPDRNVRLLLIARGVAGFFGVFGMYFSLMYLPLSEATVLTFLAPILTCYLCSFVIPGETFSRQQQIAGFVSLSGVVFIARPLSLVAAFAGKGVSDGGAGVGGPGTGSSISGGGDAGMSDPNTGTGSIQPTPSQHLLAIGIAMLGVCGATIAMTSIRAIGTRAHAFISITYFSVWCSFVSFVALLIMPSVNFRLPDNLTEWALLLSLSICGFITQGLLTMGLAYKNTGKGGGDGQPKTETGARKAVGEAADDIEMQTDALRGKRNEPGSSSSVPAEETSRRRSSRQPRRPKQTAKSSSSGTKATSMVYTQMLFALAGDRVVFGITPGVWSWIGSGLILAGAIWVASARDGPSKTRMTRNDNVVGDNSGGQIDLDIPLTTEGGGRLRPKGEDADRAPVEETVGLLQDDTIDERDERDEHDVYDNDSHGGDAIRTADRGAVVRP